MTVHDRNAKAANDTDYLAKCSLSPAQSRIWLLSETGNEVVYGRQILGIVFSSISLDLAREGLSELSRQHPLITSEFETRAGGAVQQILKNDRFVEIIETTLTAGENPDEALTAAATAEQARPIDLTDGNPARFILLAQEGRAVGALFSLHAILADAAALDLLATDFLRNIDGHDPADIVETALPDAASWMIANGAPRLAAPELIDFWFQRLTGQENIASLLPQTSAGKNTADEAWFEHTLDVPIQSSADISEDMLASSGSPCGAIPDTALRGSAWSRVRKGKELPPATRTC